MLNSGGIWLAGHLLKEGSCDGIVVAARSLSRLARSGGRRKQGMPSR
jgi:hypothetical protein